MPGRPLPHCLRRLTWLACVPLAFAVTLTSIDFMIDDQHRKPKPINWIRPQDEAQVRATKPIDNTLLRLVEWMYPDSPRAATPSSQQGHAPAIPPLRAFAISMWIHGESGETTLALRCKDPAHDISYCIGTDKPDGNVRLVDVDVQPEVAKFTVARDDERHTFVFNRSREFRSRILSFSPAVNAQEDSGSSVAANRQPSLRHPDLKTVPFFDNHGKCIGMRVTGIRRGCDWHQRGIARGDVVLAADDVNVSDPSTFRERLRSGWSPKSIRVGRLEGSELREVKLGG